MRYVLQEWELFVELPAGCIESEGLEEIRECFHNAHHAHYGFSREDKTG